MWQTVLSRLYLLVFVWRRQSDLAGCVSCQSWRWMQHLPLWLQPIEKLDTGVEASSSPLWSQWHGLLFVSAGTRSCNNIEMLNWQLRKRERWRRIRLQTGVLHLHCLLVWSQQSAGELTEDGQVGNIWWCSCFWTRAETLEDKLYSSPETNQYKCCIKHLVQKMRVQIFAFQ